MSPSAVPSTQLGRLLHYGGLAAGIGLGALNESFRRATSSPMTEGGTSSLMFSPANMERFVRKLSRMRGAALKLGQMISIQGMQQSPSFLYFECGTKVVYVFLGYRLKFTSCADS
jgi:aarF domain-containing kinase